MTSPWRRERDARFGVFYEPARTLDVSRVGSCPLTVLRSAFREHETVSQRRAGWNAGINLLPIAFGSAFLLARSARFAPIRFVVLSSALYAMGLALFVAAKMSLLRRGRYISWGSKDMTTWNRRAYRMGYVLILLGSAGAMAFIAAWR
jgi:hypothetical protein